MLRRLFALAFAVIALTFGAAAAPATADHRTLTFPDRLELPDGFWPEGIAIGRGPTAWVGSLVDGDIYRLDLRTGRGEVAIEGPGTGAVGLALDHQGRLFVSGGFAGDARVYDVHSGDLLASYSFADAPTVVNDVTLTRRAAYFTDSSNPTLYVVPLGRNGQPPADEDKFFRLEPLGRLGADARCRGHQRQRHHPHAGRTGVAGGEHRHRQLVPGGPEERARRRGRPGRP
ncbi:YncE family protein [Georgenia yuyongxinii]